MKVDALLPTLAAATVFALLSCATPTPPRAEVVVPEPLAIAQPSVPVPSPPPVVIVIPSEVFEPVETPPVPAPVIVVVQPEPVVESLPVVVTPPVEPQLPIIPDGAIVAEGYAVVVDGDVASGRRAAIDDALNAAIEMALGVSVRSEREVINYALQRSVITSQSEGSVARYVILEEEHLGDLCRVLLAAVLEDRELESIGLDAVPVLSRVAAGTDPDRISWGHIVSDLLAAEGFTLETSDRAVLDIRTNLDSEIVNTFGGQHVAEANVRMEMRSIATGTLMWRDTEVIRGERSNREEIAKRSAVEVASRTLVDRLVDHLVRSTEPLVEHRLIVTGPLSASTHAEIERALSDVDGFSRPGTGLRGDGASSWSFTVAPKSLSGLSETLESMTGITLSIQAHTTHRTVAACQ